MERKIDDAQAVKEQGQELKQVEKPVSAIDAAAALLAQIQAENKKRGELLLREEALRAEDMLGGSSEAGQAPPVKKEKTDKEYADEVMSGEHNG